MTDFIDNEIALHSPNPRPSSQAQISYLPLVLWHVLRATEEGAKGIGHRMDSPCHLVDLACKALNGVGIPAANGSLVRKVCAPLIAVYVGLHVARLFSEADARKYIVRQRSEDLFRKRLSEVLSAHDHRIARDLYEFVPCCSVREILRLPETFVFVNDSDPSLKGTQVLIEFGRVLFS